MFFLLISISSPSAGNTIPNPLSISMVVVTKKKIKSRKAISAMEDVGISPPLNLRLPLLIIINHIILIPGGCN
jgi:hypothetical protein